VKKVGRSGAKSAPPRSVFQIPAVQALLFQISSFCIVLVLAYSLAAVLGWSMNVLVAACLQGVVAAGLSWWRGLAPWWLFIQLLFLPVLLLTLSLQWSPFIFLAAFLILLFLYWSTFRTQVPYYPSRLSTWQAVEGLLPVGQKINFIDIGSGLGGLVMSLARRRPESRFIGIEIAPLPWLVSSLRARLGASGARFERGDYGHLNFADYDVVFAYLSPAAMPALWRKARAEMRSGTLLLSYEFIIPGTTPDIVLSPDTSGAQLYGWRI